MDVSKRPIIKEAMRIGGRKVETADVIEVRYPQVMPSMREKHLRSRPITRPNLHVTNANRSCSVRLN